LSLPRGKGASLRLRPACVLLIVALSAAPSAVGASAGSPADAPGFLARTATGQTLRFAAPAEVVAGTRSSWNVEVPEFGATVRRVADAEWELQLAAHQDLAEVWFPWVKAPLDAATDPARAVVYLPALLGVAMRSSEALAIGLGTLSYPGECFAPLLVVGDERGALIAAATNWPPRRVAPGFGAEGLSLRYRSMPRATKRTYRALVVRATGDPEVGRPAWTVALDSYRSWLAAEMRSAGLAPLRTPDWLATADGWIDVQLQNLNRFDAAALARQWDRFGATLGWMQFWGQMSDYAGARTSAPTPISFRAATTGCCLDVIGMHSRYEPSLVALARRIASTGRVGFYSRPRSPYTRLDAPAGSSELGFLTGWLDQNRTGYGANAFYVDVLGHRDFGEPLAVAQIVRDRLPPGTVIEYPVDIYPAAFLASGSLSGGSWNGNAARDLDLADPAFRRTTFPRFGRYLLGERPMFLGEANGDHKFWGRSHGYEGERLAFLLGAKLDAIHVAEEGAPDKLDRAVELIVRTRKNVGWWGRDPVYLDRRDVAHLPPGIDARVFRGSRGERLVAIDNWQQLAGRSFELAGRRIDVPADPLSILVVDASPADVAPASGS